MLRRISKFVRCSGPEPVSEDDKNMQQDPEPFGGFRNSSEKDSFDQMRGSAPDHRFPREQSRKKFRRRSRSREMDLYRVPAPVPLAIHAQIVRSYENTRRIGLSGGYISLAGYIVEVPPLTIQPRHRLKLKLNFFDVREDEGVWTFFGPEVDLEPNGITFSQPVLMTIPTCYVPINSQTATVKIQDKVDNWWGDTYHTTVVDRNINFSIQEFNPLRFLMRIGDFLKTIAHMLYIRQEGENEYEVIWCFYDDLMETTLEAKKQMELQDFTSSGKSGIFMMRHNNDVKISLEIPDCDIEDHTQIIPARNLWVSDAIVKVEFNIKNLGDRFNITDMTGKITVHENEIIVL